MFELGGHVQELLVIFVVALLVVGPKRLPEVGRMLARAMRELRRASDEFRATIETNLNPDDPAPGPSAPEPAPSEPSSPTAPDVPPSVASTPATAPDTGGGRTSPNVDPACSMRASAVGRSASLTWTGSHLSALTMLKRRGFADALCEPPG